jgi:UDP-glucose 4-epimerase
VNESIGWISTYLELNPKLKYTGGERGWVGDNPLVFLDTSKINNSGWKPRLTIKESVLKTIRFLQENRWILAKRD